MSRCKGCGKDFRRGRRRSLLQTDGTLASAIVCPACANRCLQVLAPAFYVPPRELVIEGGELLQKMRASLQVFRRSAEINMRGLEADERARVMGHIEGLDQAIELVANALIGRL